MGPGLEAGHSSLTDSPGASTGPQHLFVSIVFGTVGFSHTLSAGRDKVAEAGGEQVPLSSCARAVSSPGT